MKSSKSSSSLKNSFPFLSPADGGVYIRLRVRPRASRSSLVGTHGDALAVAVTSAPVDGEANKAIIKLLAKVLGVKKGQIEIVSGSGAKDKRIRIEGLSLKEAEEIFARELKL
jgi:uncharacterized protein (TIGR00251 family)